MLLVGEIFLIYAGMLVLSHGMLTSETALAMVKKPSEFKWMYNAERI